MDNNIDDTDEFDFDTWWNSLDDIESEDYNTWCQENQIKDCRET